MGYKVIRIISFNKSIKKLIKRHKNTLKDLKELNILLNSNSLVGDEIFKNFYKIRVKNSSTNKGKSGGFRVIYYYLDNDNNIYLIDIYSKSDQENVKKSHLIKLLKDENLN